MTNRDRINQMSNEEFANWLKDEVSRCTHCAFCYKDLNCRNATDCQEGILKWLESEVEE